MSDLDPRQAAGARASAADFARQFTSRAGITHILVVNGGQLGRISVEDFLRDIYEEPDTSTRYMALKPKNSDPTQETKFVEADFLGSNGVMFEGNRLAQSYPTPPDNTSSSVLGIAVDTQIGVPFYASSDSIEPENGVLALEKQGVVSISGETFDVYKTRDPHSNLLWIHFYAFFRRDAIIPETD